MYSKEIILKCLKSGFHFFVRLYDSIAYTGIAYTGIYKLLNSIKKMVENSLEGGGDSNTIACVFVLTCVCSMLMGALQAPVSFQALSCEFYM